MPSKHEVESRILQFRKIAAVAVALGSLVITKADSHLPDEVLINNTSPKPINPVSIRVLSANVHGWVNPVNKKDNFYQFLSVVNREKPDVICMQEVVNSKEKLADISNTGYTVYFTGTKMNLRGQREGNALAAKSKLTDHQSITLSDHDTKIMRRAQYAQVETTSGKLAVANVHLSYRDSENSQQWLRFLKNTGDNYDIACGDFNRSAAGLTFMSANDTSGGMSFPIESTAHTRITTFASKNFVDQIDHVFVKCGKIDEVRTTNINSDHRGVIANINTSDCKKQTN